MNILVEFFFFRIMFLAPGNVHNPAKNEGGNVLHHGPNKLVQLLTECIFKFADKLMRPSDSFPVVVPSQKANGYLLCSRLFCEHLKLSEIALQIKHEVKKISILQKKNIGLFCAMN